MGQFVRQCIPTDSRPFLTLNPAGGSRQEASTGLHCYFNDDVVVDLRVDTFNGRSSVVNSHHLPPHLLLHTDVVVELTHVLHQFIVPTPRLQYEVSYLSRLLRPTLYSNTAGSLQADVLSRPASIGTLGA